MPKYLMTERWTADYLIEAKDVDEAREICDQIPLSYQALTLQGTDVESLTDAQAEAGGYNDWRLYTRDDVDMPQPAPPLTN